VFSLLKTMLGLVVALFVCFQLAYSQQTEKTETKDAELREKAYATLETLANQISNLQSAENRARFGTNIAESLWRRDETRARALLQLVADDLKLGFQPYQRDKYSAHDAQVFLKLREDTVRRIAKLDAELALAVVRETFPSVKEAFTRSDGSLYHEIGSREHALEVEVAKALSRKNPEIALKLARKALAQGLDDGLFMLLLQLADKHQDDARVLHKEIVTRLGEKNLRRDYPALEFSQKLAQYFTPPRADEATFRELINLLLTTALANGCGNPNPHQTGVNIEFCTRFTLIVPQMQRLFPDRAERMKRWATNDARLELSAYRELTFQLNEIYDSGTIEDLLALVPKYPELAQEIILQAMRKAESQGDFERAQKIANDYNGDPEIQQRLKVRAEAYELTAAKTAAQLEQLDANLAHLPPIYKIRMLISFANHAAVHDRKSSLKVLGQVREMVDGLKPGSEQTRALMEMAFIYCLAKSDQGFVVMEAMVPKLNELIAAGAKLDGYGVRYLRDGEWNMSGEGEIGALLTRLANHANYFAWQDFDRAMNLAAQFERAEIRMMAQLRLAQAILAGPAKRLDSDSLFN
jgi:hypothetical protein